MLKGNKIAAYGTTRDAHGREVIQEFRQCTHCQFTWVPKIGSGRKYGMCTYCMGLICNKCLKRRWKQVSNKCVPFSEGVASNTKGYVLDEKLGLFLRA